jgi:hypothetical protein
MQTRLVAALAIALSEKNGETQMRRMAKDTERVWICAGGPLFKLHTAVKPGTKNSDA